MRTALRYAVLTELAAAGPINSELRRLAIDRADRAESAVAVVDNMLLLGTALRKMAARVAASVREEHAAGVKVRRYDR